MNELRRLPKLGRVSAESVSSVVLGVICAIIVQILYADSEKFREAIVARSLHFWADPRGVDVYVGWRESPISWKSLGVGSEHRLAILDEISRLVDLHVIDFGERAVSTAFTIEFGGSTLDSIIEMTRNLEEL